MAKNDHEEPCVWMSEEIYPGIRQYVPHCTIHMRCREDFEKSIRGGGKIKESDHKRLSETILRKHFGHLAAQMKAQILGGI